MLRSLDRGHRDDRVGPGKFTNNFESEKGSSDVFNPPYLGNVRCGDSVSSHEDPGSCPGPRLYLHCVLKQNTKLRLLQSTQL